MSEDCQKCGTMMWDLDEDGHCPDCSYYQESEEENDLLNKYEMYESYYKDRYASTNVVACIEEAYPELLQDDVIGDCIAEIRMLTFIIDNRMKEIADLNTGEVRSVRLPGVIHNTTIKGTI